MNKAALVAYLKIEVEELAVWLAQEWIVPVRLGADPYLPTRISAMPTSPALASSWI